jgi:hypothetical protein
MQTAYTVTRPVAKRIKLGKVERASSSKSPAKAKRTGANRKVRGRLQNVLSLSFDVLFLVFPAPIPSLSVVTTHFLDIRRIGAHGSCKPRTDEQISATGIDVAQVHVGLDSGAKEYTGYYGSGSSRRHV